MDELINRLDKVGNELYRKFGTESYTLRCEVYDIREAMKKLHKPAIINQVCDEEDYDDNGNMRCGRCHRLKGESD